MLILDPSIEEMKFRFGEHKKTHPKRLNLKHTLKQTMKPKPTQQKWNFLFVGWRVCLEQQNQEEQSEQMLDPVNKWIEPLLLIQGAQLAMKMCYMNRIRT